jgi:hypothetical protein
MLTNNSAHMRVNNIRPSACCALFVHSLVQDFIPILKTMVPAQYRRIEWHVSYFKITLLLKKMLNILDNN